jgi:nucleoside-diphosphate-sugar epimerase
VDDLIDGLVRLMNLNNWHEPVNLGNANEFTVKQLAEEVARVCGCALRVRHAPLPQDDPLQRQPNIQRARELLGWQPTVQLHEGLERTVAYFAKRIPKQQSQSVAS